MCHVTPCRINEIVLKKYSTVLIIISSIQSQDPAADPRVEPVGVRRLRRAQRLHLPQGLCCALPGEPLDRGRRRLGQD